MQNINPSVWVHESSDLYGNVAIGEGSIVAGVPAKLRDHGAPTAKVKTERDSHQANRMNAWLYNRNAQFYAQSRHDAWGSDDFDAWRVAKSAEIATDADLF